MKNLLLTISLLASAAAIAQNNMTGPINKEMCAVILGNLQNHSNLEQFRIGQRVETPSGYQNTINKFWSDGTIHVFNAEALWNPNSRYLPEQLKFVVRR